MSEIFHGSRFDTLSTSPPTVAISFFFFSHYYFFPLTNRAREEIIHFHSAQRSLSLILAVNFFPSPPPLHVVGPIFSTNETNMGRFVKFALPR